MSVARRGGLRARLLGALTTGIIGLVMGVGVFATPASAADDANSGTVDTSRATIQQGGPTDNGECTGVCKRINWCDHTSGKSAPIADDAPYVRVDGGGSPDCVQKPHVRYECCVPNDNGGVATVTVTVHNPNQVKLKVRIGLDDGKTQDKWVDGGQTVKFVFTGVANGKHTIHAAVAAGQSTWCKFGDTIINVTCATTKPTPSHSPSPKPSGSQSTAPGGAVPSGTTPSKSLPVTGPSVWIYAGIGMALVGGGGALLWLLRRRRDNVRFVTP